MTPGESCPQCHRVACICPVADPAAIAAVASIASASIDRARLLLELVELHSLERCAERQALQVELATTRHTLTTTATEPPPCR